MQVDLEKITSLAESVTATFGLNVLDVKLGQQGKRRTIEVTICRKSGRISLNDCEQVSRTLEEKLDQESPPLMDGSFSLDVQSPGIDRKLSSEREFAFFAGQPVEVKTKQKVEGLGCDFTGTLVGLDNGRVLISQPAKAASNESPKRKTKAQSEKDADAVPQQLEVELNNIISVRLHPVMPKVDDQSEENIANIG